MKNKLSKDIEGHLLKVNDIVLMPDGRQVLIKKINRNVATVALYSNESAIGDDFYWLFNIQIPCSKLMYLT
jgi:hypothetical protein